MLLARARLYLRDLRSEPAVIVCFASALLIISHHQAGTGYFREVFGARFDKNPAIGALTHLYWFAASFFLYCIMPLLISVVTRGSFHRKYGFGLGDWRAGLTISALFLAVMLPAVYVASVGHAHVRPREPIRPQIKAGYLLITMSWVQGLFIAILSDWCVDPVELGTHAAAWCRRLMMHLDLLLTVYGSTERSAHWY